MKDEKDYGFIGIIIMFLLVLVEMMLLMFGAALNNPTLVTVLLVLIPLVICAGFIIKYRKNHMRHIYTKEDLKAQHKDWECIDAPDEQFERLGLT